MSGKRVARKSSRGRPTKYSPTFVTQGQKLAEMGATDREVAEFFGISESMLYRYQHVHPEFREALKVGKEAADDRVEKALYRKAIGYSHDAVKIMQSQGAELVVPYTEHVPPDTTACIFWLKNRRRGEWRDKVDHEHAGPNGGAIAIISGTMTPAEAAAAYAATLNHGEG